ncbi:MAG: 3-hydroxyisobutyrate dehydrogenase, partial [Alphaproteobacteria bacterium]
MRIGFIGLGRMGAPMARNLARAGHEVTGFDIAAVSVEGVTPAADAVAAARGRDAVITMLPDGAALRAVYAQILPAAAPGTLMLDCSTVDVASARDMAAEAVAAGLMPLDAPVWGGVGGAEAGTLTFMVGGSTEAFERAGP